MPAKKHYLSSPPQRVLKVSAAIVGGYFVAASFHLMLASVSGYKEIVMLTSTFSLFLLWAMMMVVTFLSRNGWKIWGFYLGLTLFFSIITYFTK